MDKKQKDMKEDAKTANHSKEEVKGTHTSKTTDHKMDDKKEGSKKEEERRSNTSNTK